MKTRIIRDEPGDGDRADGEGPQHGNPSGYQANRPTRAVESWPRSTGGA
jgi:hypothetical protein